ncbi:hypothetical protein GCM10022254_04430 [Actinomadura meridiana]|uniref:Ankyrin repeat domain-containing protein n=1 Tax=Actinomadura meridiana TaxID=559626 RepID=A0ABP8BSA4_9ACTN
MDESGWPYVHPHDWTDVEKIRALLEGGADPDGEANYGVRALHLAAEYGSPAVVAELAERVSDIDAEDHGRSALWVAVCHHRMDNVRPLIEAGADPWRTMMGGWSPGRLSLAGATPDLFEVPESEAGLSAAESALVVSALRLNEMLDDADRYSEGLSLACVAGVGAEEAVRALGGSTLTAAEIDPQEEDDIDIIGVTDVPGGCVLSQPWGYAPQMPGVMARLSVGTFAYGLYANPKSGDQGCISENGATTAWDLSPGYPGSAATPRDVLVGYVTPHNAIAHCFVYAGLEPRDARSVEGPPDIWMRLPELDWWK